MRWFCIGLLLMTAPAFAAEPLVVSAAVSLKESFTEIGKAYEKQTGQKVEFNFGATGHLLAQIREGAPVDLFVAASDAQMDQAEQQGLVEGETRAAVTGNEMVLIVPRGSTIAMKTFDEVASSAIKRLAIGQPKTVPAGEYAMQVLRHLKLDTVVADRTVYGSSVRQVLDYVARGEVDAGIVYATDAREAADGVKVMATAQAEWHDPIRYAAAVVKTSKHSTETKQFVAFLRGEASQQILAKAGFVPPTTRPTRPGNDR